MKKSDNYSQIKPLNDYVFLSYSKKKDDGKGIILSDVSKEKASILKVEGIGDKVEKVKVGDIVVIDPFLPREIKIDGENYFLLKEKDIFAIIK